MCVSAAICSCWPGARGGHYVDKAGQRAVLLYSHPGNELHSERSADIGHLSLPVGLGAAETQEKMTVFRDVAPCTLVEV
jgi:hypothetical protein